ncbi:helix-turn-helix domain-containing protein [Chitinophaga oryziterrae]|uniref:Helix-turn-helix domain-containing protein n=1 Tax=Chitinophaga oryziterrae TaxID=1031224 RepID=A0A6N8J5S2_9BACT|nr:AraC family transcriptional regulator [Chitinophaga oryziterrae]MVT40274.1 helix-turn-helix domain-containing protein [Chitinophaga oryziterrae]
MMQLTAYEIQILNEIYIEIESNFKKRVPIADVIGKYHISVSTLSKAFKILFQKTIDQHRLEVTINYAKKRLQEGAQVKIVASELGYANTSSFCRTYKKVTKHSPLKQIP